MLTLLILYQIRQLQHMALLLPEHLDGVDQLGPKHIILNAKKLDLQHGQESLLILWITLFTLSQYIQIHRPYQAEVIGIAFKESVLMEKPAIGVSSAQ
jgi:hypothetical protein